MAEIAEQIGKSQRTVRHGSMKENSVTMSDAAVARLTRIYPSSPGDGRKDVEIFCNYGESSLNKVMTVHISRCTTIWAATFRSRLYFRRCRRLQFRLVNKGRSVRQIYRSGGPPLIPTPSPRQTLWMLLKPEKLKEPEQEVIKSLVELSPEIEKAVKLANHFYQLMKERKVGQLSAWMEEAQNSRIPKLRAFVRGIENDRTVIDSGNESRMEQ